MHRENDPAAPRHQSDPRYTASYRAFLQEHYAEAIPPLRDLLAETAAPGEVLNDIGVCHWLAGDRPQAREAWERATALLGRRSAAHLNLAYAFKLARLNPCRNPISRHRYSLPVPSASLNSTLVSIIILEYENPGITLNCLRSLHASGPRVPIEVILIDNSTRGPATDFATMAEFPNLVYQKNERNLGFAGGCNQGARLAHGELLYFVNNDTLFQSDCIEELAGVLLSDRRVGAVGSKLLYADGSIQHAGMVFDSLNGRPKNRHRLYPAGDPAVDIPLRMQAVTGASLMVRRVNFLELGGFSESYVNGYEDVDLCLRLAKAGLQVVYNPRSVLYHLESGSRGRSAYEPENRALFYRNWRTDIRPDELEYLTAKDHFMLSYSDLPAKATRRDKIYALCSFLVRRHPDLTPVAPLALVEKHKHVRIHKFCQYLFDQLLRQGDRTGARVIFRYFVIRRWYRFDQVRRMLYALCLPPSRSRAG